MSIALPSPSTTTSEDLEAAVGAYAERLFMTGLDAFEAFTIGSGPPARPVRRPRGSGSEHGGDPRCDNEH